MADTVTPIGRAALPLAAATTALAVGAAAETVAANGDIWDTWMVVMDSAVGVVLVASGLTAWLARPESRTGPALIAMGGLWFLGAFGYGTDQALVDYTFGLQGWNDVVLVALLLALSTGGLRDRSAQVIVVGLVLSHTVLALARLLLRPPNDITSCFCIPNRITGITEPDTYEAVVRVASVAEAAFAVAALVLLATRWRRATGPARRTLGALLIAGAAVAALVTYNRVITRVLSDPVQPSDGMLIALNVVRTAIPIAIAASLVRGRRARTRVADLVVSLDHGGHGVDPAIFRTALADPEVRLLRWSPERDAYLDADGNEAALPGRGDPQGAIVLERDGTILGALVHDAALREEPELLGSVAAAARLALDNERLADEVRARLGEVRASRRRIVEAGDAERRRLEHDLHDGAQQRLVAVALNLRTLERRAAGGGDVALADGLGALADELDATMRDIRELARGIRPPVLTEAGLAAALEALAERMPVPVDTDLRIAGRLPDAVEATAYFAASEGLANVLKHADAQRVGLTAVEDGGELTLTVSDDGRGGADMAAGSGLVGLADRLDALGGALSVHSPPGEGTTVVASVPLHAVVVSRRPSRAGT